MGEWGAEEKVTIMVLRPQENFISFFINVFNIIEENLLPNIKVGGLLKRFLETSA